MIPRLARAAGAIAIAALTALSWSDGALASVRTDESEPSGLSLEIASFSPTIAVQGSVITVGARVTNGSDVPVPGVNVSLEMTATPLTSRARLDAFIEDPRSTPMTTVASRPLVGSLNGMTSATGAVLQGNATETATLVAATTELPVNAWGVYGLRLTVSDSSGVVAQRTMALTWMDAEIPSLPLAMVATASGGEDRVARVAGAAAAPGVAIAVDPTVVTGAASGITLRSLESFTLASGNPDFTSLAHAQADSLADAAVADMRDNAPAALTGGPWIAPVAVTDEATIDALVSREARAAIVDVASAGDLALPTGAPVVDITSPRGTLPVIVPDAGLSNLVATYRPAAPDAAARVVADAALLAQESDGTTPVVVSPGDAWVLPGLGASDVVTSLVEAPWVRPVSLGAVIDGEHRLAALATTDADTSADLPLAGVESLERRLTRIEALATTTGDPDDIYLPGLRNLLAPTAMTLRADSEARATTLDTTLAIADETLSAVGVNAGSNVNLIASSGNVPISVRNDLGVDSTVRVVMRSSSPNLRIKDSPSVTVPAGGTVTAMVPVEGVSSADVFVTVTLENADMTVIAAPASLQIRVRADWGNATTAVFTVLLAALLVAGIVRTVRRGRKTTRLGPDDAVTAERARAAEAQAQAAETEIIRKAARDD